MLVAALALFTAGTRTPPTGEAVCAAEPENLFLLQSGLALVQPLRSRVFSLLQTETEAHPQAPVESPDGNILETGSQQVSAKVAEPAPNGSSAVAEGGRPDPSGRSAVTVVMPPKSSRAGISLATGTQNITQRDEGKKFDGHGDTDDKAPQQQDDDEDHTDRKRDEKPKNNNGEHEDHDDSSPSDQVPMTNYTPDIFDIPSEKCQKPCVNGICHDGECFCRYPFVGLQCDIVAISEVGKVLALTVLVGVGLFTALCVLIVFRANQKTSAAAPVQEAHMADEEWLPPPADAS